VIRSKTSCMYASAWFSFLDSTLYGQYSYYCSWQASWEDNSLTETTKNRRAFWIRECPRSETFSVRNENARRRPTRHAKRSTSCAICSYARLMPQWHSNFSHWFLYIPFPMYASTRSNTISCCILSHFPAPSSVFSLKRGIKKRCAASSTVTS